jgi:tetratricopeptide (TPR) repeat protein
VDIDVQERPTADFTLVSPELSTPVETETVACAAGPELVQAQTIEMAPVPETPEPDRDDEEMHEIEMGIARFRRVVQLNPRNAHAWDALGTLFKSAGLYKDAILAYQQAISNDSSKSLYYHHLGLVYACEGRDEDAIGAFQRVIEIDPEYSLAHATLGGYYRKMGLEELAQKHIGKAMKNIFDSENEYNRACLEAICGNADQAIELLNVALKNKQTYVDWILRDPDLDFIRQDPRFKQLISEYSR